MAEVKMPHEAHEKHLCLLHNIGFISEKFEEYKGLVKNGRYVCKSCGRVAASDKNLCRPEAL